METKGKTPEWVDPAKVFEWEQKTPLREGIISIQVLFQEASRHCNWLMFYCWCYSRTQGFTNKCMRDWDFGNYGGRFKTCREGAQDALSEFVKYDDTSLLAEQVEVEKLYAQIEAFCKGVVWTEPHKPPEPPKPEPIPEPIPVPPVEPKPDPKPEEPAEPGTPKPGLPWVKIIGGVLIVAAGIAIKFIPMPGIVGVAIDMALKFLKTYLGI